jgi:hypothetical protein
MSDDAVKQMIQCTGFKMSDDAVRQMIQCSNIEVPAEQQQHAHHNRPAAHEMSD